MFNTYNDNRMWKPNSFGSAKTDILGILKEMAEEFSF